MPTLSAEEYQFTVLNIIVTVMECLMEIKTFLMGGKIKKKTSGSRDRMREVYHDFRMGSGGGKKRRETNKNKNVFLLSRKKKILLFFSKKYKQQT